MVGDSVCSSENVGDLASSKPSSGGSVCWCKMTNTKVDANENSTLLSVGGRTFWVKQLDGGNHCSNTASCASYCASMYYGEGAPGAGDVSKLESCRDGDTTFDWAPNRARLLLQD